jgi:hypothetical protein
MPVRLEFLLSDVATRVDEGYVELKIERDSGTGFAELSVSTTRPPLRDVVLRYVYQDPSGDVEWDYRATPVMADGTEYPTPTVADVVVDDAYTTLAAIRAEGVLEADVDDARVNSFITLASQYIHEVTRNCFTPRFQIIQVTGERDKRLFLDAPPIIALQKMEIDGVEEDLDALVVNNRHLRNGLTSPDDRKNPMVAFADSLLVDDGVRLESLGGGRFSDARQVIKIWGIFGFTDLPIGSVAGETYTGSQVPLDYGSTPGLIEWCARMLVIQKCYPFISDKSLMVSMRDRINKQKTRDQEIVFFQNSSTNGGGSFSDGFDVDEVLRAFSKPLKIGFV